MKSKYFLSSITVAALISACGGGGTNTSTASSSAASAAFDLIYQPLQTNVPAAPYSLGSREAAEFKTLNEQRAACGFGLLAHDESLRLAALDHSNYLNQNSSAISTAFNSGTVSDNIGGNVNWHQQYLQFPNGFTGATPDARARFRGYTRKSVAEISAGSVSSPDSARGLISAPYHAGAALYGFTEVGIAAGGRIVFKLGYPSKLQRKDASLLTYPCAGVTGTPVALTGESPSPYSPRNLAVNPIGHPVYFFVDQSIAVPTGRQSQIDVTDLAVTEDATGFAVAMLPVQTRDNDPNALYVSPGFAYAAPDKPLKHLTKYRVRATAKANGVTTQVDYTFTTS